MIYDFLKPSNLGELLKLKSENHDVNILAGGTDLLIKMKENIINPTVVVSIKGIKELEGIKEHGDYIKIGAITTHNTISNSKIILDFANALATSSSVVGSTQIRNLGTIGGNICNASPAGDTIPTLLSLNASILLESINGVREIFLKDFLYKPGKTLIEPHEILTYIKFRKIKNNEGISFLKEGKRNALAISIINCASFLKIDGIKIVDAKISLGSIAAKTIRILEAENFLIGKDGNYENFEEAGKIVANSINPIDDVRATGQYRKTISKVIVVRTLTDAFKIARGDKT